MSYPNSPYLTTKLELSCSDPRNEKEADALTRELAERSASLERVKMESSLEIEKVRGALRGAMGSIESCYGLSRSLLIELCCQWL